MDMYLPILYFHTVDKDMLRYNIDFLKPWKIENVLLYISVYSLCSLCLHHEVHELDGHNHKCLKTSVYSLKFVLELLY